MFDLFFQPPLLLWLPNTSFPEMIVKKKNVGAVVVFADEFFFLTKSRMLFVPFGRVSCWLVIRVMLRQSSSHHAWSHLLLPGPATDVMGQHPFADAELKWLQGNPSQAVRWPVRLCVSIFNNNKKNSLYMKMTVSGNDALWIIQCLGCHISKTNKQLNLWLIGAMYSDVWIFWTAALNWLGGSTIVHF